ncbi:GDSL esterase/lipase At4g28780-like [Tasmannia lanceolata]|uniref:GDSL esterase/lipase At4g28780-like n=1 Tax=Tasmannia lanceolata TaxID=3420 RepID=UPI0040629A29
MYMYKYTRKASENLHTSRYHLEAEAPPMAEQWHLVLVLTLCLSIIALGAADREVPTIFVFGDSTADVGTNNYLARSEAEADFPFNGIDFPDAIPTGRFSNGLNSADFVGSRILDSTGNTFNMYNLGARKFGIIAAPPIGFCPSQRSRNATDPLNTMARLYYSSLRTLLQTLSSELPGMKYSLGNAYKMVINFMDDPMAFGFKEIRSACCGSGEFNGENICTTNATLCTNRHEYLFWDLFHPTQAASKLAAETLYSGSTAFVRPINFKQLADDYS